MKGLRASRLTGLVLLGGMAVLLVGFQPAEGHSRRAALSPVSPPALEVNDPEPGPAPAIVSGPSEPPVLIAGPSTSLAPWLAIVAGLALAGAIARRWPRVVTLALIPMLTVFVAESTIHSVHHIDDPRGAAQCQVLSVAQHVHGDAPAAEITADAPADVGPLLVMLADPLLAAPALRPDQGRAPPARSV